MLAVNIITNYSHVMLTYISRTEKRNAKCNENDEKSATTRRAIVRSADLFVRRRGRQICKIILPLVLALIEMGFQRQKLVTDLVLIQQVEERRLIGRRDTRSTD